MHGSPLITLRLVQLSYYAKATLAIIAGGSVGVFCWVFAVGVLSALNIL